jgi:hypothetical protein
MAVRGSFGAQEFVAATEKMLSCPRTGLKGSRTSILAAKFLVSSAAAIMTLPAVMMGSS